MLDCKFYHISELADRSARNIVSTDLIADAYHYNIFTAARILSMHGYGNACYQGQVASGKTFWAGHRYYASVRTDGMLEISNV